jgi:serine/threonine protein kinase
VLHIHARLFSLAFIQPPRRYNELMPPVATREPEGKTPALGQPFTRGGRSFVRAQVPSGDNRGRTFTIAQPLAGRYQVERFLASGGMGLILEGLDLRTHTQVLIKSILHYDVIPYARVRDREGFTNHLRVPRKTLEMERRILVLLRNAGCNAVPHPNDFVYDINPHLEGPYKTEDDEIWKYDDEEMIAAEPYLVMEYIRGQSLEEVLRHEKKLSEPRAMRIMHQVNEVLRSLHQPTQMKPGMTWRLIYQDLKPGNMLLSEQDRITVLDLGGCQLINLDTKQKLLPGACTAGYCPPECEQPYALLSPTADVYTVGTNLFHLLTGQSPLEFIAANLAKTQPRAVHLDTSLLDSVCRPKLRQLIEKCLDFDVNKRFQDIPTLQRALSAIMVEG